MLHSGWSTVMGDPSKDSTHQATSKLGETDPHSEEFDLGKLLAGYGVYSHPHICVLLSLLVLPLFLSVLANIE